MNHELDYDRDHDREDALSDSTLKNILHQSLERENEMMRSYLITADQLHGNNELKDTLKEFAEGNAKRSRQILEALRNFQ